MRFSQGIGNRSLAVGMILTSQAMVVDRRFTENTGWTPIGHDPNAEAHTVINHQKNELQDEIREIVQFNAELLRRGLGFIQNCGLGLSIDCAVNVIDEIEELTNFVLGSDNETDYLEQINNALEEHTQKLEEITAGMDELQDEIERNQIQIQQINSKIIEENLHNFVDEISDITHALNFQRHNGQLPEVWEGVVFGEKLTDAAQFLNGANLFLEGFMETLQPEDFEYIDAIVALHEVTLGQWIVAELNLHEAFGEDADQEISDIRQKFQKLYNTITSTQETLLERYKSQLVKEDYDPNWGSASCECYGQPGFESDFHYVWRIMFHSCSRDCPTNRPQCMKKLIDESFQLEFLLHTHLEDEVEFDHQYTTVPRVFGGYNVIPSCRMYVEMEYTTDPSEWPLPWPDRMDHILDNQKRIAVQDYEATQMLVTNIAEYRDYSLNTTEPIVVVPGTYYPGIDLIHIPEDTLDEPVVVMTDKNTTLIIGTTIGVICFSLVICILGYSLHSYVKTKRIEQEEDHELRMARASKTVAEPNFIDQTDQKLQTDLNAKTMTSLQEQSNFSLSLSSVSKQDKNDIEAQKDDSDKNVKVKETQIDHDGRPELARRGSLKDQHLRMLVDSQVPSSYATIKVVNTQKGLEEDIECAQDEQNPENITEETEYSEQNPEKEARNAVKQAQRLAKAGNHLSAQEVEAFDVNINDNDRRKPHIVNKL